MEKPDTEYKTRSDEWSGKVPGAMKIYSKHIKPTLGDQEQLHGEWALKLSLKNE